MKFKLPLYLLLFFVSISVISQACTPAATSSNAFVCSGSTVTLRATNGVSYSWSNGATTDSIVVSSAAVYSVTVTNGSSCTTVLHDTVTASSVSTNTPDLITKVAPPSGSGFTGLQSVTINGNYAYLATLGVPGGLTIYDISSMSSPVRKGSVNTYGPYCTAVQGSYAYQTGTNSTVYVMNVSNPDTPKIVGTVTVSGGVGGLYSSAISGSYLFVASQNKGLIVVDVSNPSSPSVVYTEGGTTNKTSGITIVGNTLYTTNYQTASPWTVRYLKVWDVSTPTSPSLLTTYTIPPTTFKPADVMIFGNYAYVADRNNNKVAIIDVTTPSSPNYLSSMTTSQPNGLKGVTWVNGNLAYLFTGAAGTGGAIDIYDITSKSSPVFVSTLVTEPNTHTYSGGTGLGRYLYAADYNTSAGGYLAVYKTPMINHTVTVCTGDTALLYASGGTTYLWSTGATTDSIRTAAGGVYTVTVTNASGCSTIVSDTVNVLAIPTVNSPSICTGDTATLTATGGAHYSWSTGDTTVSIKRTTAGTYTVTATNSLGCTTTATGTVTINAKPTPNADSPTVCAGHVATLTATGGVRYSWSTGDTLATTSTSTAGTYTVTATNAAGCSATARGLVTVNSNPTPSVNSATICSGATATLTTSGGTRYAWSNSDTTSSISVSAGGTYTVTATNALGCTATASGTLTVNANPTPTVNSPSICAGDTANLTATGSTSYVWNTTATTSSISTTAAGTYTVTATNSAGCTATASGTVTVNALPTPTVTNDTICSGDTATLTATGGISYLWSTTAATASITSTTAGAYSVTVSNAAGCTATASGTVIVNASPITSVDNDSICPGSQTLLTAGGGSSYLWSNGDTTTSISVSTAGIFIVKVTANNGCITIEHDTVTLKQNGVTVNNDTVCFGTNGTLTAMGGGHYRWSTGDTLSSISYSGAGIYSVTATSTSGCTASAIGSIVINPRLGINVSNAHLCFGSMVTLNAIGGTGYLWSTGATSASIIIDTIGIYSVTITNPYGCSAILNDTFAAFVANPSPTVNNAVICTGSLATLTATGGTSYLWSTGASGSNITTGSAGTYTVTATNSSGCTATANGIVTVHANPLLQVNSDSVCQGDTAILTASGALHYRWSNGDTLPSIRTTVGGTYIVFSKDSMGCISNSTGIVTIMARPVLIVDSVTVCSGDTAILTVSGGSSYHWSTGDTLNTIHEVSSGIYTVTASNIFGCSSVGTGVINVNMKPAPAISASLICIGGYPSLTASGGTHYQWSTGDTTPTINTTSVGTFTVTAMNDFGCSAIASTTDTGYISPSFTINSRTVCSGDTATLIAMGGVTYLWNTGDTFSSIRTSLSGLYSVTATDAGCTASATGTVTVNIIPSLAVPSDTVCSGTRATLTATGGIHYLWSTGDTTIGIQTSTSGIYSVTATNIYGCTATANGSIYTLSSPPTVPALQSACTDSVYNFVFTSLTAGEGGDHIEWSTNSRFDSSTILSSPSNVSIAVLSGSIDTIWVRSRNSTNGCIGDSTIAVLKAYPLPFNTYAHARDTLIPDSSAIIVIPTSQIGIKYQVLSGSSVVASVIGNGYTMHIPVFAYDTTSLFRVYAADTVSVCNSKDTAIVIFKQLPAPPVAPPTQSAFSDSARMFTFLNVSAGRGGDKIEWSTTCSFSGSTIATSPTNISVMVPTQSSVLVWMRTKNSITGAVGKSVTTMAVNNKTVSTISNYVSLATQEDMHKSLGTNEPVGETPGYHNTTPTGAATYTIPIVIPAGTNNMSPQISLEYNSQAGNGHLGLGWNLGGLSSISRAGLNNFYDGQTGPVTFTNNDHFLLDGQILVPINGNNGESGTSYAKTLEDYSVTTSNGSFGSIGLHAGPASFKVVTKQGIIMEYGNTDDSKVMSDDGLNIVAWRINKVIDLDGNYFVFKYHSDDYDPRISEIDYTGNDNQGTPAYNTIQFAYAPRNDSYTAYTAGQKLNFKYLLTSVNITGLGTSFKKYDLAYGTDGITSHLTSVTEHGTDGSSLNPTVFKYGDVPSFASYTATSDNFLNGKLNSTVKNKQLLSADFNGDGYTDMVTIEQGLVGPPPDNLHNTQCSVSFMNPVTKKFDFKKNIGPDPISADYASTMTQSLNTGLYYWHHLGQPNASDAQGDYNYFTGDFFGTGRSGVLRITKRFQNPDTWIGPIPPSLLQLKDITYFTFDNFGSTTSHQFDLPPIDNSDKALSPEHWFYQGDFDGDGKQDYIIVTSNGAYVSFPGHQPPEYNKPISQPSVTVVSGTLAQNCNSWLNLNCPNNQTYVGDFNGDGKSDLLIVNDSLTYTVDSKVFNLILDSHGEYVLRPLFTCPALNSNNNTTGAILGYYLGDFNGDGKTDMLVRQSTIISHAEPLISPAVVSPTALTFPNYASSVQRVTDDQNSTSMTYWNVYYSTGNAFTSGTNIKSYSYAPSVGEANKTFDPIIGDFNGDGKSDILFDYNHITKTDDHWNYSGCTDLDIYYSTGNGFNQYNVATGIGQMDPRYMVEGDFNGDGRTDVSFYNLAAPTVNVSGQSCTSLTTDDYLQFSFNPKGQERLLQQVLDGFNQLKTFNYTLLTDPIVHKQGSNFDYPLTSAQPAINVVSQIIVPDGVGGTNITDYRYEDAEIHRGGRGFLGFSNINSISHLSGTTARVGNAFRPPYYIPTCNNSAILFNNSTTELSHVYNSYAITPLGNPSPTLIQRCAVQKIQEFDVNGLAGTYKEGDYSYDNYGNVINSTVDVNGIETTVTNTQYEAHGTPVPAKPTLINMTRSRSGAPAYNNMTAFGYNPKGHVVAKIDGLGKDCYVTSVLEYDGWGNLSSSQTIAATSAGGTRTQRYKYDGFGRFPVTVTNTLGQEQQLRYFGSGQLWGKPTEVQNIDQTLDFYSYDAFGRQIQHITPRGIFVTSTYAWDVDQNSTNSVFSILTHADGSPDVKVWNDAIGREVQRTMQGFGTQGLMTSNVIYNNMGKIAWKVGPYYAATASAPFSYTDYDGLGRPIYLLNQFGSSTIAYSYAADGGLVTDITDAAARHTQKVIDATGKTVKSSDNGGELSFKYDSYGNQIETDMAGHATLTSQYDACNHMTQTSEPNSGSYHYQYDGYGQLLSQTDADAHTYTMMYDVGGRITTRSGPEGTTSYLYYQPGDNGVNQIHQISQSGGGSQAYEYDALGQMTKSTDNIGGHAYATAYEYDPYGNIKSVLYPSGYPFTYDYDANGYLLDIKNYATNHTMYTVNSMNEYGQATTYTTGNGKSSTLTSTYGVPTRYTTSGVQDLELTYDWPSMDLMSRTDHAPPTGTTPLTETFTYDASDRLTSSQVGTNAAMTYAYAANGNLTSKTDAGAYIYDPVKTNAVRHVSNPSGNISSHDQDITYTGFNKAATISENGHELDLTYGPDHNRKASVLKSGGSTVATHIYSGSYEEVDDQTGHPKQLHYLSGVNGLMAIVVTDNTGAMDEHYVYTDQLGSILTVTDASGAVEARQNFDAWGRDRNPSDWTYTMTGVPAAPVWLYRGYTGHEHLREFALINMNGRMYDPLLGKMLRPDIMINDATNTQAYNMYSYASNNPLKYTDPSGWDDGEGDENGSEDSQNTSSDANSNIWAGNNGSSGTFDYTWGGRTYNINYTIDDANNYSFSASPSDNIGFSPYNGETSPRGEDYPTRGSAGGSFAGLPQDAIQDIASRLHALAELSNPPAVENLPTPSPEMLSSMQASIRGDGIGIQAAPSSMASDWAQSTSIAGRATYSMANDMWIGAQGLLGLSMFNKGGTINNLGGGIASTSQKINGLAGAIALFIPLEGMEGAAAYTKSDLVTGQAMHNAYKLADHAPELGMFKEYRGIKGIRPDFVDFNTNTIYELKPFNPRGINGGRQQLLNYIETFEQTYPGTKWKGVLDFY